MFSYLNKILVLKRLQQIKIFCKKSFVYVYQSCFVAVTSAVGDISRGINRILSGSVNNISQKKWQMCSNVKWLHKTISSHAYTKTQKKTGIQFTDDAKAFYTIDPY